MTAKYETLKRGIVSFGTGYGFAALCMSVMGMATVAYQASGAIFLLAASIVWIFYGGITE